MSKTTADVLKKARLILIENGWCQGSYTNHTGQCCAIGAVYTASSAVSRRLRARGALSRALQRKGASDVVPWNDAPGRTKEEVLALFTSAIRSENARKD